MPPKKISKFYGKKNISVWLFQKPEFLSVWVPEPTLSHTPSLSYEASLNDSCIFFQFKLLLEIVRRHQHDEQVLEFQEQVIFFS